MMERIIQRLPTILPIFILGIVIDQLSKMWAVTALKGGPHYNFFFDTIRIGYAENIGAFLGLGSNLSPTARFWLLTLLVGVFLSALFVYLLIGRSLDKISIIALSLVLSGGFSNFIDRAMNEGAVVDFMNMGISGLRTGIFNIADVYIMVGAGVMIVGPWWLERRAKK